jgi:hypothetical protein
MRGTRGTKEKKKVQWLAWWTLDLEVGYSRPSHKIYRGVFK